MKTRFFSLRRWFTLSALSLASLGTVSAQEPGTVQTPPAHTDASAGVKLPYGVEDVVKLTKAQVGEEIILSYVQNSGTVYNLTPHEIVYLRDQGVSNPVINAMV